jgi:hypothetical protein
MLWIQRLLVALTLVLALAAGALALDQPICTWENAAYGEHKLQSVHILRNGQRIGSVHYLATFDAYYVQCKGIPRTETFQTPNDAAWAACWLCR